MPKPYTDTEERNALLDGAWALDYLRQLAQRSAYPNAPRTVAEMKASADALREMVDCYVAD